jgi:eukaryotic-like serine/threonine-protein kinase
MICTACNNKNIEGARFCNSCGATLPRQSPASSPDTGQPSALLEAEKKDELIGRIVESRYRIDGLIGLGGMGAVYRVTRLLIGDEVAMKILHTERVADPHAGERFRREAQAAARLKHPNAVSIYDFGITSDGLQYLVMELVEGQSLRQIIKQEGPLPASVAAEVTTQVCAALDQAHQQHIVHRDVKPDNIIIHSTLSGLRVKVLDFGIAKLRDDVASHLTQTGSVMGTPHYMSPEQCLGEELDNRADIYSMGIVLYEMLCGRVPFNSPISTAVVVQHVNQPPPALRSINLGVSPHVEAVVLHALQKSRDARPVSATALARAFSAAVHQGSATAPSDLTWPRAPAPVQAPTHATEETVMRHAAPTPTANEMPATVHLPAAQASGPRPSVRSTAPTGALGVTKTNQKLLFGVGAAILGVVLLGIVIGVVAWSLSGKPNEVASAGTDNNAANPTPPLGMSYVRGQEFTMGSKSGDVLEQPSHTVTVRPFFIDTHEVTREDYQKFVNATGHPAPGGWTNGSYPSGTAKWPVTGVSWDDANAYASWVGKRLPTEAEWEFAARGTDGRRYPWGNEWKSQAANAGPTSVNHVDPVGSNQNGMSPSGAFDMVGNAWEWTATDLAAYPGGQLPDRLSDGSELKRGKVIRGGCFLSNGDQATTTFRRGWPPRGENYDNTGFRLAKDIDNGTQR